MARLDSQTSPEWFYCFYWLALIDNSGQNTLAEEERVQTRMARFLSAT